MCYVPLNYHGLVSRRTHVRTVLFFLLIALTHGASTSGEVTVSLKTVLTWSRPGNEIDSISFSPDGKFIVLVSREHEADGAEAEGLPESYFKVVEERNRKDPRFADPVARVIGLDGKTVCEIAYGWNPNISPDNKTVAYSRQKKPITGFRLLAETQEGNDIQAFDCETRQSKLIAAPAKGYLDNPVFVEGGSALLYTQNEGVNGSYAGTISIEKFDLQQNRRTIALGERAVPSVPCPPKGNPEQTRVSMICSLATNRKAQFYSLIFDFDFAGIPPIALVGTPIPSLTDPYMASQYDMHLMSITPTPNVAFPLGKPRLVISMNSLFSQPQISAFSFFRTPGDYSTQTPTRGFLTSGPRTPSAAASTVPI